MRFTNTIFAAVSAVALLAAAPLAVRAQDAAQPVPAAPADAAPAAGATPEAAPSAEAPPAPEPVRNPSDIAARIGDATVTEAEVTLARTEFGSELEQVPPEQQRSVVIDALVNMKLMARAAEDEQLGQGAEFENRLAFLRMQALRNSYVEKHIVGALTPEELQAGYQTLILAEHKPEEQLKARHILVETKEEAEKIIADLKGGAAFEELAKQSKDPSGQNGGDLGFFGKGQMVPPFESAVYALQPGAITETPVQTEFGWHVIKLEEKRMSQPPAVAEVEGELRNYLLRQKFEAAITALRAKYPVEIVGQPAAPAAAAPAEGAAPADGAAPAEMPAAPAEAPAAGAPAPN